MVGGQPYMPARKPVPAPSTAKMQSVTQIVPDSQLPPLQSGVNSHSRTRTSSSNVFPYMQAGGAPPIQQPTASPASYQNNMNQYNSSRRTLSNATASTSGTGNPLIPTRSGSTMSASLRRSGSARSGTTVIGYVANMRKQKGTVWCDRAQTEDPRLAAQRKAAKAKATINLAGLNTVGRQPASGSGSLVGSRGKIRGHGKSPAINYSPADLVRGVGGMPKRFISSEVGGDGDDSDDEDGRYGGHQRSGSGRSSLGSSRRATGLKPINAPGSHRLSTGYTPPSGNGSSPNEELMETPIAAKKVEYFPSATPTGISAGSGSSGERKYSFRGMARLHEHETPAPILNRDGTVKKIGELRRRGSVDDRTMTMGGGKLYIANPDLSD